MITLQQIADLFIHDFAGGIVSKDEKIKLDRRDVIKKARLYLNQVLKPEFFAKMNEGDRSAISQAIYSYELTLQTDSTNQGFVTLPDWYISLPHNRGIHRLYVKGNYYDEFIIMANPGVSGRLPHTKIKGNQFCTIEGLTIKMGPGSTAKKADRLILQVINAAPDAILETDPLPAAPEHVAEVMRLLKADYTPTAQVPVDNLNNQNPNIR